MDIAVRDARPERVEIGFLVSDHRDHGGRGKHGLGHLCGFDPVARLLVVQKPLLVALCLLLTARGHRRRFGPRPQSAADQPEALTARSIDGNHRMQQDAMANPLANQPQTAAMTFRRAKVNFTGILDGQHMSPRGGWRRLLAPSGDDLGNADARIAQQTPKADLDLFPAVRQTAQAAGLQMHHTVEKHRPPFRGDGPQIGQGFAPYRPLLPSVPE
jgi:hypothetical protein